MKNRRFDRSAGAFAVLAVSGGLVLGALQAQDEKPNPALAALVPQVEGWKPEEARQSFFPENLYEYIDGAAESYLSYDFKELLVVQLKKEGTPATLTVEIYDMGQTQSAFGVFSAERYPENGPVSVGDLGYLEGESLNFTAGRYYVKLLSFGLGEGTAAALTDYGQKLAGAVPDKGALPAPLRLFPKENLVARSEKYVRKNFLGYEFLHDGYTATYGLNGQQVEGFMAEAASEKEAEEMLGRLLDALAKDKQVPEKIDLGYRVKNRYAQHMYLGRVRNVLCGVMRVPDGLVTEGERAFKALTDALGRAPGTKGPRP
jgi:hypothetical protein